jgi:hypothetical protein
MENNNDDQIYTQKEFINSVVSFESILNETDPVKSYPNIIKMISRNCFSKWTVNIFSKHLKFKNNNKMKDIWIENSKSVVIVYIIHKQSTNTSTPMNFVISKDIYKDKMNTTNAIYAIYSLYVSDDNNIISDTNYIELISKSFKKSAIVVFNGFLTQNCIKKKMSECIYNKTMINNVSISGYYYVLKDITSSFFFDLTNIPKDDIVKPASSFRNMISVQHQPIDTISTNNFTSKIYDMKETDHVNELKSLDNNDTQDSQSSTSSSNSLFSDGDSMSCDVNEFKYTPTKWVHIVDAKCLELTQTDILFISEKNFDIESESKKRLLLLLKLYEEHDIHKNMHLFDPNRKLTKNEETAKKSIYNNIDKSLSINLPILHESCFYRDKLTINFLLTILTSKISLDNDKIIKIYIDMEYIIFVCNWMSINDKNDIILNLKLNKLKISLHDINENYENAFNNISQFFLQQMLYISDMTRLFLNKSIPAAKYKTSSFTITNDDMDIQTKKDKMEESKKNTNNFLSEKSLIFREMIQKSIK